MPAYDNPDQFEPDVLKQARADAFQATVDMQAKWDEAKANAPSGHSWVKQGPHITCHSCPTPHSHYVGHEFDARQLAKHNMVSHVSTTPAPVVDTGDIIPQASTEPQRGRKEKGQ